MEPILNTNRRVFCFGPNRLLIVLLFLSLAILGQAQKHDYIWVNGYDADTGPEFAHFYLDFHKNPPEIMNTDFGTAKFSSEVSSFSDEEGNLILASNGCRFFNAQGEVIPGADSINPGSFYDSWCKNNGSYILTYGMIILPLANDYFFAYHLGVRNDNNFTYALSPSYYSMFKNNLGIITTENVNVIIEKFHSERPAACLHGNGKEWWVITPERMTSNYHIYKINKKGDVVTSIQNIGYNYPYIPCEADGMHSFSSDGKTYVRYNNTCGLSFFDFDRCTGTLSNERRIILPEVFSPGACSVFSSNSQFCYFNSSRVIIQVDMKDPLLQMDTVAIVDTFPAAFGAGFYLMQRGPDGRIYVCTTSSNKSWHVIEYPDLKGPACKVTPSAISFPSWSFHALPNIPNYRLGAWSGSPCDTLSVSTTDLASISEIAHRIFPNPVSGHFTLELDEGLQHPDPWSFRVMNSMGQEVSLSVIPPYAYLHHVTCDSWPPGVYFYQIVNDNGWLVAKGRLVKVE
jgi:hypothetical protein